MADTAVKVKIAWGKKEKKSSIKINAKTLGGALEQLEKLDEWGKFDGPIDYAYKANGDGLVTEVTLKPSYTIKMPMWTGYSKAPKACQKEWDRMWKKLDEHEDKHRLIHLEAVTIIHDTLAKKTDLTVEQLHADMKKMEQDGQANQDKFDTSSGHGANAGVELNITQECE
jgi:predicted secreted Zn-dependent protease